MRHHQVIPERHITERAQSAPARRIPVFFLCAVAAIAIGAALRGPFYGFIPAFVLTCLAGCLLRGIGDRDNRRHPWIAGIALIMVVYAWLQPPSAATLLAEVGSPIVPRKVRVAAIWLRDPQFGLRIDGTLNELLAVAEAVGPERGIDAGWPYAGFRRIWWQPPERHASTREFDRPVRIWERGTDGNELGGTVYSALLDVNRGVLYVLISRT